MDIKDILTDTPTKKIVPGYGPTNADVLILGATPDSIAYIEPLKSVLIPHANLDPTLCRYESVAQENVKLNSKQLAAIKPDLFARIDTVGPRVIIAMGRVANIALGINGTLSTLHGKSTKIFSVRNEYIVYTMYDPEAAQLDKDILPSLLADWKNVGRDLNYIASIGTDPVDTELAEEGWMEVPKALRLTTA